MLHPRIFKCACKFHCYRGNRNNQTVPRWSIPSGFLLSHTNTQLRGQRFHFTDAVNIINLNSRWGRSGGQRMCHVIWCLVTRLFVPYYHFVIYVEMQRFSWCRSRMSRQNWLGLELRTARSYTVTDCRSDLRSIAGLWMNLWFEMEVARCWRRRANWGRSTRTENNELVC